jgi:hypothetical protein
MSESIVDWEAYLDHMAALVDTNIPDEYRVAVIEYLKLTHTIAQPMLEFELPEDCEPAPVFRP